MGEIDFINFGFWVDFSVCLFKIREEGHTESHSLHTHSLTPSTKTDDDDDDDNHWQIKKYSLMQNINKNKLSIDAGHSFTSLPNYRR